MTQPLPGQGQEHELRKAISALYLAVPDRVADDVSAKANAVLAQANSYREALAKLVELKDGPHDDAYRAAKGGAWEQARAALGIRRGG